MEVQTSMPLGEFELMAPLLGEHCFENYNYDFTSCFSSNYHPGNWPQEDTHNGLNWEGYCNIDAAEINGEIIDPKPTKRKCETESNLSSCTEAPKKKPCISITNEREENEGMSNKNNHHDSGSCLPDNGSTDKSGAPESPGKYTKHCLYARKRREKISQKLKTLQKLIPNGTKVDISTMLEEAYQYVKFLQLQIKLLSSEELWMYAPIAFNGISDAQNHIISQAQQQGAKFAPYYTMYCCQKLCKY